VFIASFSSGPWQANTYLLRASEDTDQVIIIDPGMGSADIVRRVLKEQSWQLAGVLGTHGHVDHIGDAALLANENSVPLWLHSADDYMLLRPSAGVGEDSLPVIMQWVGSDHLPAPEQRVDLADKHKIEVAGITFGIQHAPGHTPGSVLFTTGAVETKPDGTQVSRRITFSGDVLFAGSIGRTDMPGGDQLTMIDTLSRVVLAIPDDNRILPGHGEPTVMSVEKASNPYLQPEFLEINI
jgi:glyoxylase-like metal-dependent hydrolase (beta-lactamase superfamily II)